ncbi:MAG: VOC family protein [Pseudomonadota bacterium]
MSDVVPNFALRPKKPTWTHLALHVSDMEKTIDWFETYTHLRLLVRGEVDLAYNAWLGDPSEPESPFVLVLAQFLEGKDPFAPQKHAVLAPFAHIGIEVPEREMIDEIAEKAREGGCLALGPKQMPKQVGYICFLNDPDGNIIEFSFDQGVYHTAREKWGKPDTAQ